MMRRQHAFAKLQALILLIDMHSASGRPYPKPVVSAVSLQLLPCNFSDLLVIKYKSTKHHCDRELQSYRYQRFLVSQSQAGLLSVTVCSIFHYIIAMARRIRWADGVSKLRQTVAVIRCS